MLILELREGISLDLSLHTQRPSSIRPCLFLCHRIMSFRPPCKINLFKLTKILLDYDRCMQWCKEHNLLASSFPCPKSECCNAIRWTRRSASREE